MRLELPGLIRLLGYGIALLGAGSLLPYLPLLPRLALLVGLAAGLYAEHRRSQLIPPPGPDHYFYCAVSLVCCPVQPGQPGAAGGQHPGRAAGS